jgi:hypothetical protein
MNGEINGNRNKTGMKRAPCEARKRLAKKTLNGSNVCEENHNVFHADIFFLILIDKAEAYCIKIDAPASLLQV